VTAAVAWIVSERDRSEVVWARNAMEARRLGASELGHMLDEESYEYRRAPEFDGFTGNIEELRRAQLAAGWWFDCAWCDCGRRVSEDEGDDGEPCEPVVRGDAVYCSEWHAGAEVVRHVERRIRIWEAIAAAVERFPGATIHYVSDRCHGSHHTDGKWRELVSMRVPGVDCAVDWFTGDEEIRLPVAHTDAYREYKLRRAAGEFG
jgi:hypothetical protein